MLSPRPLLFLTLWYIFSGLTLFLNKYILEGLQGDPTILGTSQMSMTLLFGYIQMHFPMGMSGKHKENIKRSRQFYNKMVAVGSMRFLTVLTGLISLNYIPPSFTETIKSSAPLFTVVITFVLTGERTSVLTLLSLIPVMTGLGLCSFNEVGFNLKGFLAAGGCNACECLQNVYSKLLISGDSSFRCSPASLQFYTSLASTVIQIPVAYFLVDFDKFEAGQLPLFLLNGVFFHFQSISAYVLMDYISPVAHSVANTLKRALLIIFSLYLYGNEVSLLSGVGMVVLFVGVGLYGESVKLSGYKKSDDEQVLLLEEKKSHHDVI